MNYTKEEQYIVIVSKVNAADGEVSAEEVKMMLEVGVANGLNQEAMNVALSNLEKYDVEDVINSTKEDDEIQEVIFDGCVAVAEADGKIAIGEIQMIHALAEYFEWPHAYVTCKFIDLFRKNPKLEVGIE